VDAPYCTKSIRGVIYRADAGTLSLRDTACLDNDTGKWNLISMRDATSVITVPANAITVKNNGLIESQSLRPGDSIRVLTDSLPQRIGPGLEATGYIISVER